MGESYWGARHTYICTRTTPHLPRTAPPLQGIDIRKREAEALRVRISKELATKVSELTAQITGSCAKVGIIMIIVAK